MTDEEKSPTPEGEKVIREKLEQRGLNQTRATTEEDFERTQEKIMESYRLGNTTGFARDAEAPATSARTTALRPATRFLYKNRQRSRCQPSRF